MADLVFYTNESVSIAVSEGLKRRGVKAISARDAEFFVPEQIYTATEAIGFFYGVTWNSVRRNIFNWKDEEAGNLEGKIKAFCAIPQVLKFIKDYILFVEKDEELSKFILHQHQTAAVERIMERSHDAGRRRGLIWHTQGSGKTYTMIKSAEMIFKAPKLDKPTVILMIDRNELEDQMLKNLLSLSWKCFMRSYRPMPFCVST